MLVPDSELNQSLFQSLFSDFLRVGSSSRLELPLFGKSGTKNFYDSYATPQAPQSSFFAGLSGWVSGVARYLYG
ncbi:hypothetical protein [uncultured Rikenella sp.]|uniref:hypothetical protein n=1 Tax=uncultured Rikenella sp. TaxID=368003 RepID=UPI0025D82822|nr:hypothetical protein [uncultured Rikenella sp.]